MTPFIEGLIYLVVWLTLLATAVYAFKLAVDNTKIEKKEEVVVEHLGVCGHDVWLLGKAEWTGKIKGKIYKLIGWECCIDERIKELEEEGN